MSEVLFLYLIGSVWLAPHVSKVQGMVTGCLILFWTAVAKGLGWL